MANENAEQVDDTPTDEAPVEEAAEETAEAKAEEGAGGEGEGGSAEAKAQAKAEAKRKLKLKVNGQEEEWDEDKVVAEAQKSRAASRVREEAKRLREEAAKERQESAQVLQRVQEFVQQLGSNPARVLQALGYDPKQIAKSIFLPEIEEEALTPEQRTLREKERKIAEYEAKLKEIEQRDLSAKEQAAQEREYQQLGQRITNVVQKLGFVDSRNVNGIVKQAAFLIDRALDAGYEMSEEELAEELMETVKQDHTKLFKDADAKFLFDLIGEEGFKKVSTYAASRLKTKNGSPGVTKPNAPKPPPKEGAPRVFKSRKEYEQWAREMEQKAKQEVWSRGEDAV